MSAVPDRYPLEGTFELTARCNLRCKMCFVRIDAAWVRRVGDYLLHRGKSADPAESVRIGNERVALLRAYGIIE